MAVGVHDSSQTQMRIQNNPSNNTSLLGRRIDERSQDSAHRYNEKTWPQPVALGREASGTEETTMHPDDHTYSRNQSQLIP